MCRYVVGLAAAGVGLNIENNTHTVPQSCVSDLMHILSKRHLHFEITEVIQNHKGCE